MHIQSSKFAHDQYIPVAYTCDSEDPVSPPLSFEDLPEGTQSLALIMEDPDVPKEVREDQLFVHWIVYNIPPETQEFEEGKPIGMHGKNTAGDEEYRGPCPPPEYEPVEHRYFFTLYALDTVLDLNEGATKEELMDAMEEHTIEETGIVGRYRRTDSTIAE